MRIRLGSSFPASAHKKARNDSEAEDRFRTSLNDALHMLTRTSEWRAARPKYGSLRTMLLTPQDTVPFVCDQGLPVYFNGSLMYEFEKDTRPGHEGGVKVIVRKYIYSLRIGSDLDGEFLTWHWHPEVGEPTPHVHVRAEHVDVPGLRDMHVPTSRVFLEDVLLFAVRDLGASCRDNDPTALKKMRDLTRDWSTWR